MTEHKTEILELELQGTQGKKFKEFHTRTQVTLRVGTFTTRFSEQIQY